MPTRVAVIGAPGVGKTTLARTLAHLLGAPVVNSVADLSNLIPGKSVVLDGAPATLDEVAALESLPGSETELDHVVLLTAEPRYLVQRVAQLVSRERRDPVVERARLVEGDELDQICEHFARQGRLIHLDANGSEYKVQALACEALQIRL